MAEKSLDDKPKLWRTPAVALVFIVWLTLPILVFAQTIPTC